jgi:L-lactate permease
MEHWTVLLSFTILLVGVFVIKKLWAGALAALVLMLIFKGVLLQRFDGVYLPLVTASVLSLELALLLFGAYLFYTTLQTNSHFSQFIEITSSFSSQLAVVLILCVFMGSFMEGIAGFGIPAMLIAPLLITLGFKPLTSIVLPLAANTTAVTFGALGTPLNIGLGIVERDSTVVLTIVLNSLPALLLPFVLAFMYSKTERIALVWKKNRTMLIGAGFSFTIPYCVAGILSIEYPAVAAGIIGLLLFISFCVPKSERPTLDFWLKTFYPYGIFIVLLVVAKYVLYGIDWTLYEGTRPLSLYQPGIVFIAASMVYLLIVAKHEIAVRFYNQSKEVFMKTGTSMMTIFLLVCLAQLLQEDLSSIVKSYYSGLHQTTKLLLTSFIGVMGSFLSGSATMSNVLFGHAIKINEIVGSTLPLLLALLHTGSAIGNAISLQNIIMVKSVVNQPLIGYEKILQYNLLVVGVYMITIMVLSLLLMNSPFV